MTFGVPSKAMILRSTTWTPKCGIAMVHTNLVKFAIAD